MRGFEEDDWDFTIENKYRGWKSAQHKEFLFIKIFFVKRNKPHAKWSASLEPRGKRKYDLDLDYKRLTANKVPEVFERFMELNSVKEAIFKSIFRNKK